MTDTDFAPAIPILRVNDLDTSVAYYVEHLGFEIQWRSDPLAGLARGETSIMLSEGEQGHAGTWLWIPVSDVDRLYDELKQRGAMLRLPPGNYPWGSRECHVTDPDGHVLRFASESKPGAPTGDWLDDSGRRWRMQEDGSWQLIQEP